MIKMIVPKIEVTFMPFEINERAEYKQIEMARGDTAPSVEVQMYRDVDHALDISNFSAHFFLKKADQMETIINDGHTECVMVDASQGKVRYDWVSGDTYNDGIHFGEFILFDSGKKQTIKDRLRFLFQ